MSFNQCIEFFCESTGCEGTHCFSFCSHTKCYWYSDEFFYLVTKFQLQEWLFCKVVKNRLISGFCDKCRTFFHLNYIRQCLPDAWLFYPRNDGFQPLQ